MASEQEQQDLHDTVQELVSKFGLETISEVLERIAWEKAEKLLRGAHGDLLNLKKDKEIVTNQCKDCEFWYDDELYHQFSFWPEGRQCNCPKVICCCEDIVPPEITLDAALIYDPDDLNAWALFGPEFGCKHFKGKLEGEYHV